MPQSNQISLILPVRHRLTHLPMLIRLWSEQVSEIIIWDDSASLDPASVDPARVIHGCSVFGSSVKFRAANICSNELIMVADDDVIPKPGLVLDLLSHRMSLIKSGQPNNTVVSIYGRRVAKQTGYKANRRITSKTIDTAAQVSWCGRLSLSPIETYLVPMQGCSDMRLDDLYWSWQLAQRGVPIWVIPTDRWENASHATDEYSLSKSDGFFKLRDDFVRQWWPIGIEHEQTSSI